MLVHPDSVLEVESVWKKFARTAKARRGMAGESLAIPLLGRRSKPALNNNEFWAIQDVSLLLTRGEAVGLVGRNGSGKSTLLNLIAGLIQPEAGSIRTMGRVASFINLASGLHPNLSGIQNIYLKGAMEGSSQTEMKAKIDDIVEFAELGSFIDSTVGSYSSGMRMRLAFAISVHTNPNLLLVDEVLSVGDFEFKQKCLAKIRQLRDDASFVLVSHSKGDILRFCDKVMVLEQGKVTFVGDAKEGMEFYLQSGRPSERNDSASKAHEERLFINSEAIEEVTHDLVDERGRPGSSFEQGSSMTLNISFVLKRAPRNLVIGVPIHTPHGEVITAVSNEQSGVVLDCSEGERKHISVKFPSLAMNPGEYQIMVSIVDGPEFLYRDIVAKFTVQHSAELYWGVFTPVVEWSTDPLPPPRIARLD